MRRWCRLRRCLVLKVRGSVTANPPYRNKLSAKSRTMIALTSGPRMSAKASVESRRERLTPRSRRPWGRERAVVRGCNRAAHAVESRSSFGPTWGEETGPVNSNSAQSRFFLFFSFPDFCFSLYYISKFKSGFEFKHKVNAPIKIQHDMQ
jgi:hypothetical protein